MRSLLLAVVAPLVQGAALPQGAGATPSGNPNDGPMGGLFGGFGGGGSALGGLLGGLGGSGLGGSGLGGLIGGLGGSSGSNPLTGGPSQDDTTGGSGAYKSDATTDPTLANMTIYAPLEPPRDVEMPVVIFGNGGCLPSGTMFYNFLNEIASHGYLVIASGPPAPNGGKGTASAIAALASGLSQTKASDLTRAIDWVTKGVPAKYGKVDTSRLVVSGQSCGGLEAYSASYKDPRVKLTILFNSGIIDTSKTPLLADLTAPVAYFLGGPTDVAYPNGERDYVDLPEGLPAFKGNIDSGHGGTFSQIQGGSYGQLAVAFLNWQLRGDLKAGEQFSSPDSQLAKDGWTFVSKNWEKPLFPAKPQGCPA